MQRLEPLSAGTKPASTPGAPPATAHLQRLKRKPWSLAPDCWPALFGIASMLRRCSGLIMMLIQPGPWRAVRNTRAGVAGVHSAGLPLARAELWGSACLP